MQIGNIAGKLGKDATLATTQGGDKVCNFSVAVDTWDGKQKGTQWWRVSLWGKRAETLSPYLLKGVSVAVNGGIMLESYNGEPQLNLRANDVTLQGSRNASNQGGEQQRQTEPAGGGWGNDGAGYGGSQGGYDDLSDDVPF